MLEPLAAVANDDHWLRHTSRGATAKDKKREEDYRSIDVRFTDPTRNMKWQEVMPLAKTNCKATVFMVECRLSPDPDRRFKQLQALEECHQRKLTASGYINPAKKETDLWWDVAELERIMDKKDDKGRLVNAPGLPSPDGRYNFLIRA